MLTGERPFKGDYEQAVLFQFLNEEPKPISKVNPAVTFRIRTNNHQGFKERSRIALFICGRNSGRYEALSESCG